MARTIVQSQNSKEAVSDIARQKSQLRESILGSIRAMSFEDRARQSALVCGMLRESPIYQESRSVLFYAPKTDEEADIWPLIEESLMVGKEVYLPRYHADTKAYDAARISHFANDLVVGRFGIREPAAHCPKNTLKRLDLILVPGIAFSKDGSRLGRGRGFYDRLLSEFLGKTCGIGFQCQWVENIPMEQHDVVLDHILTPTLWHTVR